MLWMILTLMTALVAVGLAIPLVRRHDVARAARNDVVDVLKAQLGEIDVQAGAGVLPADEAEALKADVKRRVLAEGRAAEAPAAARPMSERNVMLLALGLVAVVVLGATGLYLKMGRPDVGRATPPASAAANGQVDPNQPAHPQGDVPAMIATLEATMKKSPGDAEGWRMLGWSYLQVGRNAEAAVAYGKAAAIQPHNAEYLSAQGEATVLAAQGQVTPVAQGIFRKAVAADPADPRARYYLGVAKDQGGDAKGAMDDWIALIKSAPPGAPWAAEVRTFVEKVAHERGVDLTGRLPPASAALAQAGPAPPEAGPSVGPTQDQVAAAGQMSDQGRQQMVEGMVNQLAAKLKANPNDRAGWEQLMRSRMVLGETGLAKAAYRDATKAFAGSPSDLNALKQTAAGLGIPAG